VSELPRHLNGKGLVGRYHELRPEERFRLVTTAGARDDERELERLVSTCPMLTYRITDPAYLDRVDASRQLAVAVALELGPRLAHVRMLETVRELLLKSQVALEILAAEAAGDAVDDEELLARAADWSLLEALAQADGQIRAGAAAVYEAFARVCRQEMGLEPEVVLRAHVGPLDLDVLEGTKPAKAELADWHELFERQWRKRVG
jgi:hypothetical protein